MEVAGKHRPRGVLRDERQDSGYDPVGQCNRTSTCFSQQGLGSTSSKSGPRGGKCRLLVPSQAPICGTESHESKFLMRVCAEMLAHSHLRTTDLWVWRKEGYEQTGCSSTFYWDTGNPCIVGTEAAWPGQGQDERPPFVFPPQEA